MTENNNNNKKINTEEFYTYRAYFQYLFIWRYIICEITRPCFHLLSAM